MTSIISRYAIDSHRNTNESSIVSTNTKYPRCIYLQQFWCTLFPKIHYLVENMTEENSKSNLRQAVHRCAKREIDFCRQCNGELWTPLACYYLWVSVKMNKMKCVMWWRGVYLSCCVYANVYQSKIYVTILLSFRE